MGPNAGISRDQNGRQPPGVGGGGGGGWEGGGGGVSSGRRPQGATLSGAPCGAEQIIQMLIDGIRLQKGRGLGSGTIGRAGRGVGGRGRGEGEFPRKKASLRHLEWGSVYSRANHTAAY